MPPYYNNSTLNSRFIFALCIPNDCDASNRGGLRNIRTIAAKTLEINDDG